MGKEFVQAVIRTAKELEQQCIEPTPERIVTELIKKGISSKKSFNTNVFNQIKKVLQEA